MRSTIFTAIAFISFSIYFAAKGNTAGSVSCLLGVFHMIENIYLRMRLNGEKSKSKKMKELQSVMYDDEKRELQQRIKNLKNEQ